jgi:ubiquinone biosynthesis protein
MLHFDKGSLKSIRIGKLLNQFFEFLRIYRLRCPSDIVFLIKAVTTIEGVGERLYPDFDIVQRAKPYVEELISERYGVKALSKRLEKSILRYAELLESLPIGLGGLLQQIRQKSFAIRLEHSGLVNLTRTVEDASRNISTSLLLASTMVGSSILVLAGRMAGESHLFQVLGMIGVLFSFGATLWALFTRFFRNK